MKTKKSAFIKLEEWRNAKDLLKKCIKNTMKTTHNMLLIATLNQSTINSKLHQIE